MSLRNFLAHLIPITNYVAQIGQETWVVMPEWGFSVYILHHQITQGQKSSCHKIGV